MPYDSTKSKAIQIRIATDKLLLQVITKVEAEQNISLKSRDQVVEMLAKQYLAG